jgi:glycosyltransferase involved in cell wall biosynthesis
LKGYSLNALQFSISKKIAMNVWIVNPYGTLPKEGWREYRSSMLARALGECGHEVTWWISNFEHRSKKFRKEGFIKENSLPDAVKIISVPSSSYARNISFARVKYEHLFGKNFRKIAETATKPHVIVLADPSLFYSKPVIGYAKKVGAKVILDVLDLWPEQFQVALPKVLRPLGGIIFSPLYNRRQRLVDSVDAVVGVTKDHLRAVNPPQSTPSTVAYLGLDYKKFMADSLKAVPTKIQSFIKKSDLVVVYAGTLGETYDIGAVLAAAKAVILKNNRIKFIFAGDGPYNQSVQSLSECFPDSVLFIGKVSADELPSIYKLCHVGICSYSKGSTVTMPVKLYDYMAGGLFVLYSINCEIDEILSQNSCGIKYTPANPEELSRLILDLAKKYKINGKTIESSNLAEMFDSRLQHSNMAHFIENIFSLKTFL